MPLFSRQHKTPLGIYVHIPFCRSKCDYCDFYSVTSRDSRLLEDYLEAVCRHIREATAFLATTDYTFPVYFDVNNDASYAYQIGSIPTSFFLNAKGELVTYHIGTMDESTLFAAIEAI